MGTEHGQGDDLELEASLVKTGFLPTIQREGSIWRRLRPQEVPPTGIPIRFINPVLKLEGAGHIVDPRPEDEDCLPHLVPWQGQISGPVDPLQGGLGYLLETVETGGLPSEKQSYFMHPFWLLYTKG